MEKRFILITSRAASTAAFQRSLLYSEYPINSLGKFAEFPKSLPLNRALASYKRIRETNPLQAPAVARPFSGPENTSGKSLAANSHSSTMYFTQSAYVSRLVFILSSTSYTLSPIDGTPP